MCDHLLEISAGLYGLNELEVRSQRVKALPLDRLLVHARAIEVADELIRRSWLGLRGLRFRFLQNAMQHVFVGLSRFPAAAPAHHCRRYGILLAPFAVGIIKEVHAGTHRLIHVTEIYAVQEWIIGGRDCRRTQRDGG